MQGRVCDGTAAIKESPALHVENGEIKVNFRFDIGSSIPELARAAQELDVKQTNIQRITKRVSGSHPDAEELKFITPPIFTEVNCRSFTFSGERSSEVGLLLLYPDGFIEVEYTIDLKKTVPISHFAQVVASVGRESDKFQRDAKDIASSVYQRIKQHVSDARDPGQSEDFIAVFLPTLKENDVEILDLESCLSKNERQFAGLLLQENEIALSRKLARKHLKQTVFYSSDNAVLIGFDGALFIGKNNVHEANVVDVANIHRLDLRVILDFLNIQTAELNALSESITRTHKLSRRKKHELEACLLRISHARQRARKVISQVTDPLLFIDDDYLTLIYKRASKVFGLQDIINRVERKISELTEIEDRINEIRRHAHGVTLELVVIWLIVIEVVPTVLTWLTGFYELCFGHYSTSGSLIYDIIKVLTNGH